MGKRVIWAALWALAGMLFVSVCCAEEPTITFSSELRTKNISDSGELLDDRPVVESDLVFSRRGSYGKLYYKRNSRSINDPGNGSRRRNEFDTILGWDRNVRGFDADVGVAYVDFMPLFKYGKGDAVQPYLKVEKDFSVSDRHTLVPGVKLEYVMPAKGNADNIKGVNIRTGLKDKWQVSRKFAACSTAYLMFDSGAYGLDRAWIGSYELGLSYAFRRWISWEISGKFIGPLTHVDDGRGAQLIGSSGLSLYY